MTAWWSEERINATVNQEYIERELGSKGHVDTLHRVLGFGDGLTDDTYLDWILERSARVFLILNQIGVPEKIFEFIDKSFGDDDLPLSQDALWELNLFGSKSETLDKKFYREQFNFLIQELEPGGHIDYGIWEVVPVDPVIRRPSIAASQPNSDQVHIHEKLYTRRRIASSSARGIDEVPFIMQLKTLTNIQHAHLVSIWATYSQDDASYILLHPSTDISLKTFLDEPPKAFKLLEKHERRDIFLTWTHCLTSALNYLHSQGLAHQSIRPSTIFVDHRNVIFLNDYSVLKALEIEETKNPYSNELYEYSAPENWLRKPHLHETDPLKTYLPGGGRTARRIPKPAPPNFKNPLLLPASPISERSKRTDSKSGSSGSSTNTRSRNTLITTLTPNHQERSMSSSSAHRKGNFAGDIFSHTTVLLVLLSQILQHSPKSFASHRSRLNRQAGRGNAPPDSSFHKNLKQVATWIDKLAKEAGQREKKDMKFWGAVVEILKLCRLGIKKEPNERIEAKVFELEIAGWVHWGLSRRRTCNCKIKDDEPPPFAVANGPREHEPASMYRIPKLQGNNQHPSGTGQREGPSSGRPVTPSAATSVCVGRGSTQPQTVDTSRAVSPSQKPVAPAIARFEDSGQSSTLPLKPYPSQESLVWGLNEVTPTDKSEGRPNSIASGEQSTIWGFGDFSDNDERMSSISRRNNLRESDTSASKSTMVEGVPRPSSDYCGDSGSEYSAHTERPVDNWPLPPGTLTLS